MRFRRPSELRFIQSILLEQHATGVSSKAMALYALGMNPDLLDVHTLGTRWPREARPYDQSDFVRCQATYDAAPKHLQRRMRPVMNAWRSQLQNEGKL